MDPPGRGDGDDGDQAGAEEAVHEAGLLAGVGRVDLLHALVLRQREQVVAAGAARHQRPADATHVYNKRKLGMVIRFTTSACE